MHYKRCDGNSIEISLILIHQLALFACVYSVLSVLSCHPQVSPSCSGYVHVSMYESVSLGHESVPQSVQLHSTARATGTR